MVTICLPGQRWQMLLSCFTDSTDREVVALLDDRMTHTHLPNHSCADLLPQLPQLPLPATLAT